MKRKSFLSSFVLITSVLFLLLISSIFSSQVLAVVAPGTLSGYAWSENIGWIQFTPGAGVPGVTIDSSGNLKGYAWSEWIGWIKFGDLTNFPSGVGTYSGNAVLDGTTFKGWARACAGTLSNDCTTMNSRTDGWDGWISLSGSGFSLVLQADGTLGISGLSNSNHWAWGSSVVGWIDFSPTGDPNSDVVFKRSFDYSAFVPPMTITKGKSQVQESRNIELSLIAGDPKPLSVSNLDRGFLASDGVTPVFPIGITLTSNGTCTPTCSSQTVTVRVDPGAASGTYQAFITEKSPTEDPTVPVKIVKFNITINNAPIPNIDSQCKATPTQARVNENITWEVVDPQGGYTYTWSGAVTGDGVTKVSSYATPGLKKATVVGFNASDEAQFSCNASVTIIRPPVIIEI